jgi:hypothetical protein
MGVRISLRAGLAAAWGGRFTGCMTHLRGRTTRGMSVRFREPQKSVVLPLTDLLPSGTNTTSRP